MAHDPRRIRAEQVILHRRPMRSHDNEISLHLLGNPDDLGIDAGAMSDEDLGMQIRGIYPTDEPGKLVFQVPR